MERIERTESFHTPSLIVAGLVAVSAQFLATGPVVGILNKQNHHANNYYLNTVSKCKMS